MISVRPCTFLLIAATTCCLAAAPECCAGAEPAADWRQECATLAREVYEASAAVFPDRWVNGITVYLWSRRRMEAERALDQAGAGRAALQDHVAHMADVDAVLKRRAATGQEPVQSYLAGDFCRADAEIARLEAEGGSRADLTAARTRRLAAAALIYNTRFETADLQDKSRGLGNLLDWSERWLWAELAPATEPHERLDAAQKYLYRAKEIEDFVQKHAARDDLLPQYRHRAAYQRADAEILVWQQQGGPGPAPVALATARLIAARATYEDAAKPGQGSGSLEELYALSNAWRTAALALATSKTEKVDAYLGHRQRMASLVTSLEQPFAEGRVVPRVFNSARYFRAEAEAWLNPRGESGHQP